MDEEELEKFNIEYLTEAVNNWNDIRFPEIYAAELIIDLFGRRHIVVHACSEDKSEIAIACLLCRICTEGSYDDHKERSQSLVGFHDVILNGSIGAVDVN